MAVDFTLPKKILVIHGVQTGDYSDLTQHKNIEAKLKESIKFRGHILIAF